MSAFFSLHRPISITLSVPPKSSSTSFDTIFASRTRSDRPAQVIATLSDTVDKLEAAAGLSQSSHESADPDLLAAVNSVSVSNNPQSSATRHLDSPPSHFPLQFPSHLLSGKFKPFNPPSAPVPLDPSSRFISEQSAAFTTELPSTTLRRTYSTILTILESTHPNGDKTYSARTSPMIADPTSSSSKTAPENRRAPFLQRMRHRQLRWEDFRRGRFEEAVAVDEPAGAAPKVRALEEEASDHGAAAMWAISVRRQRKLKMKKHKYKKLMRKTRNLRRRLERG